MKFGVQKIWSYFRPRHGQIVEFDLERQEYLSWVSKLFYKYRIRRCPSEERRLRVEQRFIVGYSKRIWSHESDDCYNVIVHYIGGEGLKTHQASELNDVDFLLIRRPFIGPNIILALLGVDGVIIGWDWIRERFR